MLSANRKTVMRMCNPSQITGIPLAQNMAPALALARHSSHRNIPVANRKTVMRMYNPPITGITLVQNMALALTLAGHSPLPFMSPAEMSQSHNASLRAEEFYITASHVFVVHRQGSLRFRWIYKCHPALPRRAPIALP